jgi:dTMP kinase
MDTRHDSTTDGTLRSVLRRPPFRRLLLGQAISSLGDWVGTVAFIAAALALTGSTFAVGAVLVIRLVPPLFAAPVGGVLSDRTDRRRLMVVCNLVQGALVASVPFGGIAWLYVVAFVHECVALLFLPARDALVPSLVSRAGLPVANGLIMASSYGTIPFAFALFSGLRMVADHTPDWVPIAEVLRDHPLAAPFFVDAATFVVAALLFAGLPRADAGRTPPADTGWGGGAFDGFRMARRTPALASLGVGVAVAMLGGGALFAVGLAYVHETLGSGDVEFGYLASLWGLGAAVGLGLVTRLVRRGEGVVFRLAIALCGAVLILMGLAPVLWLAFVAAGVFGLGFSVAVMLAMSMAQSLVRDEERGRLFGAVHLLFRLGLAAGAVGIGALASLVGELTLFGVRLDGNQVALLAGGALIVLASLAAKGANGGPSVQQEERATPRPGPRPRRRARERTGP